MTKKPNLQKRQNKALRAAFSAVEKNEMTQAQAAKSIALPRSTFHYKYHNRARIIEKLKGRATSTRTQLSPQEEDVVVEFIQSYADQSHPIRRYDVADAVEIIVEKMPAERRSKILFRQGRPGRKFLDLFSKRHQGSITFSRPSYQEEQRWIATNADVLSRHFAEIEQLIKDFGIDSQRITNLDETGFTPNRDEVGEYVTKCFSGGRSEERHKQGSRISEMSIESPSFLLCSQTEMQAGLFLLQKERLYRTGLLFRRTASSS